METNITSLPCAGHSLKSRAILTAYLSALVEGSRMFGGSRSKINSGKHSMLLGSVLPRLSYGSIGAHPGRVVDEANSNWPSHSVYVVA